MIDVGELKKGSAIELDGKIYYITEHHHIKMGRGSAQVRLKLRDVRSGTVVERSFQATDKFTPAFLDRRPVQYLYNDGALYYFMDNETYEQLTLNADQIEEMMEYLKEGLNLELLTHRGEVVTVELPVSVELEVTETEPGFRGDTATGGTKPAKLETGLVVQVPLFISPGEVVKVDTRTGEYLEKAS
ncbi:MAG: elongation factor P [Chloroflexota bacterium]|jgi:elongation factor P